MSKNTDWGGFELSFLMDIKLYFLYFGFVNLPKIMLATRFQSFLFNVLVFYCTIRKHFPVLNKDNIFNQGKPVEPSLKVKKSVMNVLVFVGYLRSLALF